MNIHLLREAQARFQSRIIDLTKERAQFYDIRDSFVKYFKPEQIGKISLDQYVIGLRGPGDGHSFCYTLERRLDGLGRIIGSTSFKFGVYFGRTKSDPAVKYRHTKKFGNDHVQAFENVRKSLVSLLIAGRNEDIRELVRNPLSPMLKGKILCTYFPDRYLNVFSPEHLNYFLTRLDLDTKANIAADPVEKREVLINFMRNDEVMQAWSLDLFSVFLYEEYPGRPKKGNAGDVPTKGILDDYEPIVFPPNPNPVFVELAVIPGPGIADYSGSLPGKSKKGKGNYEQQARRAQELGDRGEKIVVDLERKRLESLGRPDLAEMVKRISLESDAAGYDILSYEVDEGPRYIEVKATSGWVGDANFFYTANELRTAREHANYFIYMVYEVMSEEPKVWPIRNPFNPENGDIMLTPVKYRVRIAAKRSENLVVEYEKINEESKNP